jgi:hypothetical protein
VPVSVGVRHRVRLWLAVAAASAILLFALGISVRSVDRNGANCGSLVKPRDLEQVGPAGTNPRPCGGAHDADRAIALALLVAAGLMTVVVVTSRRGRGERTTDAAASA